jgi:hypothetical protein
MSEKCKYENESSKYIIGDLAFTFFPILTLIFIRIITKTKENVFMRSDWSFIAMILFGQTIIKLSQGMLKTKNEKREGNSLLIIIGLLLIGFLPPSIFFSFIEMGNGNCIIYVLQMIWIVFATISYFVIGSAGNIIGEHTLKNTDFSE